MLVFIRTNKPYQQSGTIVIDTYGYNGSVAGIDVTVENNKVTITNTVDVFRCCIGIIA